MLVQHRLVLLMGLLYYVFAGITSEIISDHSDLLEAFSRGGCSPEFSSHRHATPDPAVSDVVVVRLAFGRSGESASTGSYDRTRLIFRKLTEAGDSCVECFKTDDGVVVCVRELGVFRIAHGYVSCEIDPVAPSERLSFLEDSYREFVIDILLRYRSRFVLDAAGVSYNGHTVLLIGPSRSGKSTAAVALSLNGFGLVSDDRIILGMEKDGPHAAPYGTISWLEQEIISHFRLREMGAFIRAVENSTKMAVDLEKSGLVQREPGGPPSILLFPHLSGHASPAEFRRMTPAETFIELNRNIQHRGVATAAFVEQRTRVMKSAAERIPTFRLSLDRNLRTLDELPSAIVSLIKESTGLASAAFPVQHSTEDLSSSRF